ncbi:MAG: hypothetical protein ACUVTP_04590 [Candidatus Fervidibacter sp.]|uniref:hypothetical protein n=1 Tax=Candidatus Fervidibacter sp. TaxID=3100871 RepID=UPI0040494E06
MITKGEGVKVAHSKIATNPATEARINHRSYPFIVTHLAPSPVLTELARLERFSFCQ